MFTECKRRIIYVTAFLDMSLKNGFKKDKSKHNIINLKHNNK